MVFRETINGKTFQKIPDVLLEKNKETLNSLKAVYMYAKILMLKDKVYERKHWITNPISNQKEMSIDTMSFITGHLEMADLIRINKFEREDKKKWPINTYEIVFQPSCYKPVYNDFINYPGLSADAKGLAILLCLLKSIPKSNNGIGNAIGISGKTVKNYLAELEAAGVYDKGRQLLNEDYFPYFKQCREKKLRPVIEAYKEWIQIEDKQLSTRERRQRDYVVGLDEPEEAKARIYYWSVQTGFMGRQKEDELQTKMQKINL